MRPLATDEIIETKARLVLRGYPTQGVTMSDLVDITIELCHDDGYRPRAAQVRRVIQAMNLPHLAADTSNHRKLTLRTKHFSRVERFCTPFVGNQSSRPF